MRDILPPESARWRAFVDAFAQVVGRGRLRAGDPAAARGHRGLPSGRRGHRRRHQGDVRLRRQGRAPRRAAPGADGAACAGRSSSTARPLPWKVWYAGSELPLREAPARPLPPVRPGRRRGARRRRPVRRRRGDRAGLAVLRRLGLRRSRCCSTRSASRTTGPATSTRCRALRSQPRRALRGEPRDARAATRSGCSTPSGRRTRRSSPRRRGSPTSTATPRGRALRGGPGGPAAARHPVRRSTPASCAASTTTGARRSSTRAATLDSAQNAVGGGGRYDGLVEELGGPPTPGIGFALGVDRTLLACDDEGVFAAPAAALDVFVVDTTGGREALRADRPSSAPPDLRADRAYENRSMKSQMKVADRSGAAVAVIVGTTSSPPARLSVRPLRSGEPAVRRRPRRL